MAKSSVTVRDRGYEALRRALKSKATVSIGVFADEGSKVYEASDTKETVAEVATKHEFGLGVPERSFLRAWVDQNEAEIKTTIVKLFGEVVKGRSTPRMAFDQLGLWSVGQIQKRIADGIAPANSPKTIARKGSAVPLIDTGQLRSSITYKIIGLPDPPKPKRPPVPMSRKLQKAAKKATKVVKKVAKKVAKKATKVVKRAAKKAVRTVKRKVRARGKR